MGKKYIIELEEDAFHQTSKVGSESYLYRVKGFNSLVFDMTGIGKLTPYPEPDLEQVRKEAYADGYNTGFGRKIDASYQEGLSDAWDAVRKLEFGTDKGGIPTDTIAEIFGTPIPYRVLRDFTASEAIEKIRQYEQKQEEQIQVGDEVIAASGKAVIIDISDNKDNARYIYSDSTLGFDNICNLRKTGRRFSEVAALFEKMREDGTQNRIQETMSDDY